MLALLLPLLLVQDDPFARAEQELRALVAAHPETLALEEWGRSRADRPVLLLRVAREGDVDPALRPSVLLVSGLDGRRRDDWTVVRRHVERLAKADGELAQRLATRTLWICPLANPDGIARGIAGNGAPEDEDRDGLEGEDGPDDVDGDGRALWMRWRSPEGRWLVDRDGFLREADPARDERGLYERAREGADQDGDGEYNEDAPGGVLLERNFAQLWPEHEPGAGRYVLSEPSALALVRIVEAHPALGCVLVYGGQDNLLGKPRRNDREGRRAPTGVLEEDAWILEALGELYRDRTGRKGEDHDPWPGRFHAWVYAHMGLPCLATRLAAWSDEAAKQEGEAKEGEAAAPEAEPPKRGEAAEERARQVAWLRRSFPDAVHPWAARTLPDGREVEVGGVDDDALHRLPAARLEDLEQKHFAFLTALLDRLPAPTLAEVGTRRLGDGVYEVVALVTNEGFLPPRTALGGRLDRPRAPRLELVVADGDRLRPLLPARGAPETGPALLTGPRVALLRGLAGRGSHVETRWTVRSAEPGGLRVLLAQEGRTLATRAPEAKEGR